MSATCSQPHRPRYRGGKEARQRAILAHMVEAARFRDRVWLGSNETLAAAIGCSTRTIIRDLQELERAGRISRAGLKRWHSRCVTVRCRRTATACAARPNRAFVIQRLSGRVTGNLRTLRKMFFFEETSSSGWRALTPVPVEQAMGRLLRRQLDSNEGCEAGA
jgi:hypothetical protein